MKFLFCFTPIPGHVNPTLPVAHELISRGDEVIYISTEDFREKIEDIGAAYVSLNFKMENPFEQLEEDTISTLLSQMKAKTLDMVPELYEGIKDISIVCIVYHPAYLWGAKLSEKLQVPAATFHSTFVMNQEVTAIFARDNKAMATVMGNIMNAVEDLNLCLFQDPINPTIRCLMNVMSFLDHPFLLLDNPYHLRSADFLIRFTPSSICETDNMVGFTNGQDILMAIKKPGRTARLTNVIYERFYISINTLS